jgi:hypothetical protein
MQPDRHRPDNMAAPVGADGSAPDRRRMSSGSADQACQKTSTDIDYVHQMSRMA